MNILRETGVLPSKVPSFVLQWQSSCTLRKIVNFILFSSEFPKINTIPSFMNYAFPSQTVKFVTGSHSNIYSSVSIPVWKEFIKKYPDYNF